MRRPGLYWHKQNAAWCSQAGEVSAKSGRRKPIYFHGLPRTPEGRRRAQERLDEILRAREDAAARVEEFTLGQLAELYLKWSQANAKPLTYKGHRSVLSLFLSESSGGVPLARLPARKLTATALAAVVESWAAAGRAPNYIARMVASVQAMLNWSADPLPRREPERLIAANPVKGFGHAATRAARSPDRFAPEAEVAAFLAFLRGRAARMGPLAGRFERLTADLVEVAALTGARPGELRVAEWGDFEPAAVEVAGEVWGRITLDPKRWKAGGKTGEPREIYLPPAAVAIVGAIRALPGRHPRFIWTHKRGARAAGRGADLATHGEPWTDSSLPRKVADLRREAIAAGVPLQDSGANRFVLYRLRHTAAARLLMAEVPVATVAKLLGTSPDMIVRTYQSYLTSHLVRAAARGLGRPVPSGPAGDDGAASAGTRRPTRPA